MDEIERLKSELDGWKLVAKRDQIALAETKTAASRTYLALTDLLEVLEQDGMLSEPVEEAIRRCDLVLADVPLRLLDK